MTEIDILQTISSDLAEYYKKSVDQFELGFHTNAPVNLRHKLCVLVKDLCDFVDLPSTYTANDLIANFA